MISVLIPIYNTKPDWLHNAVVSILQQSYKQFEMLLINDCSTDQSTIDKLNELEKLDSSIRVIHLKENVGISGALNKGLEEAKYEIVARMDSDDISHAERFEKQIEYLNEHPEVDLIGADLNYLVLHEEKWHMTNNRTQHPNIVTKDIARNSLWFVNHPTVMFRKDAVVSIGGYDESLQGLSEDYELWIRMLKNDKVMHNISESLLLLRINPDSLIQNTNKNQQNFLLKTQSSL